MATLFVKIKHFFSVLPFFVSFVSQLEIPPPHLLQTGIFIVILFICAVSLHDREEVVGVNPKFIRMTGPRAAFIMEGRFRHLLPAVHCSDTTVF